MKLYTRTGDSGETSLFGGQRVRKNAPRIEACGTVDELNALLGLVRAETEDEELSGLLDKIQPMLFQLDFELATPDIVARERKGDRLVRLSEESVKDLESWIDRLDGELEPLQAFVVPGGTRSAALLHLARTVCRRAERRVVAIAESESIAPVILRYLNRLSDLLFVMARAVNGRAGVQEPEWVGHSQ